MMIGTLYPGRERADDARLALGDGQSGVRARNTGEPMTGRGRRERKSGEDASSHL